MSVIDDIKRIASQNKEAEQKIKESNLPEMPSFGEYAYVLNELAGNPMGNVPQQQQPGIELDNDTLMSKWEKYWPMIKTAIRTKEDAMQLYVLLQQELLQMKQMNAGARAKLLNMRGNQLGDRVGFDQKFSGITKANQQ